MLALFAELAALRPRPSIERIAFELGVSVRQAYRYSAAHRAQQEAAA